MFTKNVWQSQLLPFLFVAAALTVANCAKKTPAAPAAPPAITPEANAPAPSPLPRPPRPSPVMDPEEEWFRSATLAELQERLGTVYFAYDSAELHLEMKSELEKSAQWLLEPYNTLLIEVEGHCDERGTTEYNLALGDRRSVAAADYLALLGVPRDRLRVVTYGKERPQCVQSSEGCWSKNRRAFLRAVTKQSQISQ